MPSSTGIWAVGVSDTHVADFGTVLPVTDDVVAVGLEFPCIRTGQRAGGERRIHIRQFIRARGVTAITKMIQIHRTLDIFQVRQARCEFRVLGALHERRNDNRRQHPQKDHHDEDFYERERSTPRIEVMSSHTVIIPPFPDNPHKT